MPIDAISQATQAGAPPPKNDFLALSQALKNGNLAAAQKAYASIENAQKNGGPKPPADSAIAKDFAALGDALDSGDVDGAKAAFTALQNDFQALRAEGGGPPPGAGGGGKGKDDSSDSTDNSQKTIESQVSATNANGTVTVTITYTDGSTSTRTDPNPNPVVSQSPLTADNSGQLAALLNAQEQTTTTAG